MDLTHLHLLITHLLIFGILLGVVVLIFIRLLSGSVGRVSAGNIKNHR